MKSFALFVLASIAALGSIVSAQSPQDAADTINGILPKLPDCARACLSQQNVDTTQELTAESVAAFCTANLDQGALLLCLQNDGVCSNLLADFSAAFGAVSSSCEPFVGPNTLVLTSTIVRTVTTGSLTTTTRAPTRTLLETSQITRTVISASGTSTTQNNNQSGSAKLSAGTFVGLMAGLVAVAGGAFVAL
ncbi:hypothetical protein BC829DRAFT_386634 [Chytridium lagenaria]|nr:hypothetical protein BC829DRAFT_386634 [Chytridium lagenaria]